MRVLHVINKMDPQLGGVSEAVRSIAAGLTSHGVYNEIVSLDDPEADFLKKDSVKIIALGPPKSPWGYGAKLKPWLTSNIIDFDAVIVHGLWLYHSYAVHKVIKAIIRKAGLTKRAVPKFFLMPHGMLDPYFQKASGRKLKAIRNWIYWKLVESKVVNQAYGLLFTCEEESLLARLPFRPYRPGREIIVGLGIQEPPSFKLSMRDAFLDQCPGLAGDKYILYLGRIHEKKGVDLLIQAYEKLFCLNKPYSTGSMKGYITNPIKLIIAGPGLDTSYGQQLKQLLLHSAVPESSILFPGMLTGDAKWGAFYGCEAFILPSHQENFGISVVEALACSKPVLISNQVNIWREIKMAGGGVVAEDTITGTMELLQYYKSLSGEEKITMAVCARACYEKSFSRTAAASHLFQALNN